MPMEMMYAFSYQELCDMAYEEFIMLADRSCLPCAVVDAPEHPLTPRCADTVAKDWVDHVGRS